jgi:DNA-binding NarL/FixJ family response regulator
LSLPDGDGLEVIRQIHSESLPSKILAISGYMVGDVPHAALSAGATATLSKPTRLRPLLDIVCLLLHMPNTSSTGT